MLLDKTLTGNGLTTKEFRALKVGSYVLIRVNNKALVGIVTTKSTSPTYAWVLTVKNGRPYSYDVSKERIWAVGNNVFDLSKREVHGLPIITAKEIAEDTIKTAKITAADVKRLRNRMPMLSAADKFALSKKPYAVQNVADTDDHLLGPSKAKTGKR